MFNDVIAVGGPGLLIPVVLFALLVYAAKGLFGLHGRRSLHRREFLEQWDPKRIDDDLWLEVSIRHLYGTLLPAHVIRTAFAHPHTSQALVDLSELWPLFDYDSDRQSVRWRHGRHRYPKFRRLQRHLPVVKYFLLASAGAAAGYYAAHTAGLSQWVYSILAVLLIACAFLSLWNDDAEKTAAAVGEDWIKRINATSCLDEAGTLPRGSSRDAGLVNCGEEVGCQVDK